MQSNLVSFCDLLIFLSLISQFGRLTNAQGTANLSIQCESTPLWKLNLCQINCLKCGINAKCQSCPEQFQLINSRCIRKQSTAYQNIYFNDPQIQHSSSDNSIVIPKKFITLNQYLTVNNTVRLCVKDSYKFDMIGLFNQRSFLTYSTKFPTAVTNVNVRFNFLSLLPATGIDVLLNGKLIYSTIVQGQNVSRTYQASQFAEKQNYLSLPALKESSALVFIKKIQTGKANLKQSQYRSKMQLQFQISYKANVSYNQPFWAISDISIIAKKCQGCISDNLIQLGRQIGIAIGISTGLLVVLVVLLYVCIRYQQKQRFNSFSEKPSQRLPSNDDSKLDSKEQNQKIRETLSRNESLPKSKNY